ncbi:disease resistance protein RPV1-like, partial [Benincasa hispida]|uniref:disease resistance protein RPV1-like n=1 Tax=Benincasa hispida TaxID=102211 RepID=UPI0019028F3B
MFFPSKCSDEANLIEKVVQEVLKKLDLTTKELHIAKYPVGVDKQVMNLLSHVMSDGITMVGLYGIGGMGKTTLAKALHNRIANDFEGCCFLANIREASKQYEGLVRLQEKLLYEILMDDSIKVNNVHRGIIVLRDRLCSKKILLILDDIDTSEQLQVLAGGRDWFGVGSKVIATTRNHHLLSIHGFDILQKVEGLNDDEALELFSWHAFKNRHPSSDYLDLSKRGAHYCKGLPLALEVLGSFLYSTDHSKFKQILDEEYENSYLDKDIKDILQISYDGLEDDVKEIFLLISCLFARQDIERVKSKLKACSCLGVEKGITKLMNLSLLTINRSNEIEMHDLIQQMGRTIALSDTSKSQKKKKMLLDADALDVLDGDKVARVVKAIKMNFCQPTELDIDSRAFKNVKNLVLLDVNNVTFSKTLDFLPSSLRWINWSGFPFLSLPSSFSMENLIELKLPYSSIKHFGKGFMNCELLRNIYLRECKFLEEIPDLSAAINLENLSLNGCRSLIKVHESVGSVGRLASLWLSGHVNGFKQCPPYLKLKSLIHLFIADCNNIESYPHYSEEMKSLEYLHFISSNIGKLSPTIGHLTSLKVLRIFNCTELITLPTTIYHLSSLTSLYASEADLSTFPSIYPCSPSLLPNLRVLYLTKCNLTNLSFLETMAHVAPSLRELDLSENNFTSLPSCIVNFKSLRSLVTWC